MSLSVLDRVLEAKEGKYVRKKISKKQRKKMPIVIGEAAIYRAKALFSFAEGVDQDEKWID